MNMVSHLLVVMAVFGQDPGAASDGAADTTKSQIDLWVEQYAEMARAYEFHISEDPNRPLALQANPVLRWTNPVTGNGSTHGACFIWTVDGRPEVFASIFSYIPSRNESRDKRVVAHAFNSLSMEPLVGTRDQQQFWEPKPDGVSLKPIPEAPRPAASPKQRLAQMRTLARQFTASCDYGDNRHRLRLLGQPLYRYQTPEGEKPEGGLLDGALFAFVNGTDPELLLLLEARDTDDGPQWQFEGVRHSHLTLKLSHAGTEVWSYVRGKDRAPGSRQEHHYLSVHGIEVRDAVIADHREPED